MRGTPFRLILPGFALLVAVSAAACGTYATPEWAAEAQGTQVALAVTSDHETAIAPTATPTTVPPTATVESPTATTLSPTATPEPATAVPATATLESSSETVAPTMDMGHTEGDGHAEATAEAGAAPTPAPPAGDPAAGEEVFRTMFSFPDGAQWGCFVCHSPEPNVVLIGPSLFDVSTHALHNGPASIEGEGTGNIPYDYIRTSILNPPYFIAHLPEGQASWPVPMPVGFGDLLTEQQLNDVIAYVMSLQ